MGQHSDDVLPLSLPLSVPHQPQVISIAGPPRWRPDEALIDAAMNGRVTGGRLRPEDRAWLIAHLTHRGYTTDTIAAWLHCGRRTVQMARRHAVAVLTTQLIAAQAVTERATARADAARVTPAAMAQLIAERDRFRDQRGQLIDQLDNMRRRCESEALVIIKPIQPRRRPRRACAPAPTMPLFEVAG